MNALRHLFYQRAVYFLGFLSAIILAVVLVTLNSKIGCFLGLNSLHHPILDRIFINLTFLGDGLFSIIAALLLFFIWKQRLMALHIVLAFILSGILAQVLKRLFNAPRPREIIESIVFNSFFHGRTAVGWDSFPSGHTTSAFALATILALHVNKKGWGLFFLLMAILVGYSRIYLGQHFLDDVLAGAILGTLVGTMVYSLVNFKKGVFSRNVVSQKMPEDNNYTSTLAGN